MKLFIEKRKSEEIDAWFESPFNPPVIRSSHDGESFSQEYWNTHKLICETLEKLGGSCDLQGDFSMNDERGNSRWISVCLLTPKLANGGTISSIVQALKHLPERYAVAITHEDIGQPLFHVIVTADRIIATDVDGPWLRNLLEQHEM